MARGAFARTLVSSLRSTLFAHGGSYPGFARLKLGRPTTASAISCMRRSHSRFARLILVRPAADSEENDSRFAREKLMLASLGRP